VAARTLKNRRLIDPGGDFDGSHPSGAGTTLVPCSSRRRRVAYFAVIAAIALIFIFQNTAETTVRLLVPRVTMPLWGALLIAWVLGLLAGACTLRRRR